MAKCRFRGTTLKRLNACFPISETYNALWLHVPFPAVRFQTHRHRLNVINRHRVANNQINRR